MGLQHCGLKIQFSHRRNLFTKIDHQEKHTSMLWLHIIIKISWPRSCSGVTEYCLSTHQQTCRMYLVYENLCCQRRVAKEVKLSSWRTISKFREYHAHDTIQNLKNFRCWWIPEMPWYGYVLLSYVYLMLQVFLYQGFLYAVFSCSFRLYRDLVYMMWPTVRHDAVLT